jgi:hypothetical protein
MLRKQTSEKDPADWFAFAEERIRVTDLIWKHEGLTLSGIECLQEGMERYLKGYLIAKGWALVKTHDLERLLKDAVQIDSNFNRFKNFAFELTEDFFAQHYPGEDMTSVGTNYEAMRKDADELIAEIKKQLPNFFAKT